MSEPKLLLAPLAPPKATARLWTRRGFIAETWQAIGVDQPLPARGNVLMGLQHWRGLPERVTQDDLAIGISVASADTLEFAADDINRLRLVALTLAKFSDGRAYSTARRLREHGFAGIIRATGDVLLDQLPLLLRCGFDQFEITHAPTLAALDAGHLPAINTVYQQAAEQDGPHWLSRRGARLRPATSQ
jgi:phosphoadenosine phosphosulfate reductase